jgi:hypothetical protein
MNIITSFVTKDGSLFDTDDGRGSVWHGIDTGSKWSGVSDTAPNRQRRWPCW